METSDAAAVTRTFRRDESGRYAFVSSAGMYTAKGMLKETKAIKDPPTGQREVELTLEAELPGKWCAFRPQYIYGPRGRRADVSDALRRRRGFDVDSP